MSAVIIKSNPSAKRNAIVNYWLITVEYKGDTERIRYDGTDFFTTTEARKSASQYGQVVEIYICYEKK